MQAYGAVSGAIDNVEIGYNTILQIKVHTIDMATNPDSTASTSRQYERCFLKGDVNIADNVVLTNQSTVGTTQQVKVM